MMRRLFVRNYSVMNIFDRNTKRLQRSRAALADDSRDYDYLKNEVAQDLAFRLTVRRWRLALDPNFELFIFDFCAVVRSHCVLVPVE